MPFSFSPGFFKRKNKNLSVVVVAYNMPREIPRTLLSLSAGYQRHIDPDDYEIIVVDNGSDPPVDRTTFAHLAGDFRLLRIDQASPSPAHAVNRGIAAARGDIVGVMIDGARIVTPGLLHFARHGARLHPRAVVASLGWYLGYDFQRWSMRSGYDQAQEDALLAGIEWPKDGYRLFDVATMDESSVEGWFQRITESNALFMQRALWHQLGGVDERFDAPGGGLVNLDTFRRAVELRDTRLVLLLGEATFHQIHGGVATNLAVEDLAEGTRIWSDQYESIRGNPYRPPDLAHEPIYLGTLPRPMLPRFVRAALAPVRRHDLPPLGLGFDPKRWSDKPSEGSADPAVAAAIGVAQREFAAGRYGAAAAIARLIRERAPNAREPQRLLSLIAAGLEGVPERDLGAEYFRALGDAHRMLGENDAAEVNHHKAIALDGKPVPAGADDTPSSSVLRPAPMGNYFLDRDQPPLSPAETEVVRQFHELYYRHWIERGGDTKHLSWFGHQLVKCPLDLWIYQELLVRTRPDVVVETGTWYGGSALYIAMIQDLIGHGRVITVDVDAKPGCPRHPRLTYIAGSSVDEATVARVRASVGSERAMVILDSDHSAAHVYDEIIAYSPLVQAGDYLIVEDTNVNGHPVWPDFGPGPMEAVDRFLAENDEFSVDERCERFLMTINPRGYLRRRKRTS
jgi:cephalosporin hydroxylase